MLVALKLPTYEKVLSYTDEETTLKDLSKMNLLVCQECKKPLQYVSMKVANQTRYFRHKKNECPYKYWEPESNEHRRAKVEFKERLEALFPNSQVHLEHKVDETEQRSDVMVIHPNGDIWAFEIQLSKISISILKERRDLYQKANVIDFWFLGYEYSDHSLDAADKLNLIDERCLSITIDRLITIKSIYHPFGEVSIILKNLSIAWIDKYYTIIAADYNTEVEKHTSAVKSVFSARLKSLCSKNADIIENCHINDHEVADILVISLNTGVKVAFNFIINRNLQHVDIQKRQSKYEEMKITSFWIYLNFEYYRGMAVIKKSSKHLMCKSEYTYQVTSAHYGGSHINPSCYIKPINRSYINEFNIKEMVITKLINGKLILDDISVKKKFKQIEAEKHISYNDRCRKCKVKLKINTNRGTDEEYNSFCPKCKQNYGPINMQQCPRCRARMGLRSNKDNLQWHCRDCKFTIDIDI
jgi:hypothetical protein